MRTLVVLLFALAVISGARADHCPGGVPPEDPSSFDSCRDVNTEVCVFIDYGGDNCGHATLATTLYSESNGIPGYQGGDECGDGTCHGLFEPDRPIL